MTSEGKPSTPRIRTWLPLLATLLIIAVVASGCDFTVEIRISNEGAVPIRFQVNDGPWGEVEPGAAAHDFTGVNEQLRKIRIEVVGDPSSAFEQDFSRRRGYYVFVVVHGPPLKVDVTTKGY